MINRILARRRGESSFAQQIDLPFTARRMPCRIPISSGRLAWIDSAQALAGNQMQRVGNEFPTRAKAM